MSSILSFIKRLFGAFGVLKKRSRRSGILVLVMTGLFTYLTLSSFHQFMDAWTIQLNKTKILKPETFGNQNNGTASVKTRMWKNCTCQNVMNQMTINKTNYRTKAQTNNDKVNISFKNLPFNDGIKRIKVKPMPRSVPDKARRTKEAVIPNVVHVIWFYPKSKWTLSFHVYMSWYSVHKYVRPEQLIVWYTQPPCGTWWHKLLTQAPEIQLRYMDTPQDVFNQTIHFPEHKADVARLRVLIQQGGFFIDNDIVALKSWHPLRYYNMVLPAPTPTNLANGFIGAAKNVSFLLEWYEGYRHYNAKIWAENSLFVPLRLAKAKPHLIHVEWETIFRPSIRDDFKKLIFGEGQLYDWSNNYAMHLYYRYHKQEHNPEDIKSLNSTLGEIFRYIYYNQTTPLL